MLMPFRNVWILQFLIQLGRSGKSEAVLWQLLSKETWIQTNFDFVSYSDMAWRLGYTVLPAKWLQSAKKQIFSPDFHDVEDG